MTDIKTPGTPAPNLSGAPSLSGAEWRPELRRVVVTGMGIVSSIGDTIKEVTDSLKAGRSGISFIQDYADKGFKSQVAGKPKADPADHVEKRELGDPCAGQVRVKLNRPPDDSHGPSMLELLDRPIHSVVHESAIRANDVRPNIDA